VIQDKYDDHLVSLFTNGEEEHFYVRSSSFSAILHIQVTLSFNIGVLHKNLLNNYLISISKELHVKVILI